MKDLTVVYYTCNREKPEFEAKIGKALLETVGDSPLISVSHKPMPGFGQNICVGEKFPCDYNAHKQLLIGLQEAKTPFAASAEADCLFPPGYFKYVPVLDNFVYRYPNVWILNKYLNRHGSALFYRKLFSECAQIAVREFWIKAIENALAGGPEWAEEPFHSKLIFRYYEFMERPAKIAVVNFKTGDGLRNKTGTIRGQLPKNELPYWGKAVDLRKRMFGNEIDTPTFTK